MSAYKVWAFSPTNVWVIDGSATIQRFDGTSWSPFPSTSTSGLGCIFALAESDAWLCAGGSVLHWDGAQFTTMDLQTSTGISDARSLWASSDSNVWVVGMDATVGHWNGTTWERSIVGSPEKASIWGSSPSDIYALGVFDLMHYDGAAWTEVRLDSGGGDGQVWGTSASDVWVMPDSSQISHFDGSTWTTTDVNIVGELSTVWGFAPNDIWAAGTAGAIAHFDGSKWNELSHQPIGAPYLQQLTGVHGTSSKDLWVVGHQLGQGGSSGLIYHHGG